MIAGAQPPNHPLQMDFSSAVERGIYYGTYNTKKMHYKSFRKFLIKDLWNSTICYQNTCFYPLSRYLCNCETLYIWKKHDCITSYTGVSAVSLQAGRSKHAWTFMASLITFKSTARVLKKIVKTSAIWAPSDNFN